MFIQDNPSVLNTAIMGVLFGGIKGTHPNIYEVSIVLDHF